MKLGDKVQVWDEKSHKPLGWGTIVQIGLKAEEVIAGRVKEQIPLIQLEDGKKIWGDRCDWITEKKAIDVGVRLFRDIFKEPEEEQEDLTVLIREEKKSKCF
jgi:hypothetical protein